MSDLRITVASGSTELSEFTIELDAFLLLLWGAETGLEALEDRFTTLQERATFEEAAGTTSMLQREIFEATGRAV